MITEALSSTVIHLMTVLGYTGLFLLSLLESAAIPIPSEIVLPFGGFLVASGEFSFWPTVLWATFGNVVGSAILFWIGISGGRWILERYGKYVFIHETDIKKGETWFDRHGPQAVFWGRLMPVVRTFISLPAGISRMNFKKFILYTTLGALPWNMALTYIGLKAGQNWDYLRPYFHIFDIIIIIAVGVFVVWYIYKNHRHSNG